MAAPMTVLQPRLHVTRRRTRYRDDHHALSCPRYCRAVRSPSRCRAVAAPPVPQGALALRLSASMWVPPPIAPRPAGDSDVHVGSRVSAAGLLGVGRPLLRSDPLP